MQMLNFQFCILCEGQNTEVKTILCPVCNFCFLAVNGKFTRHVKICADTRAWFHGILIQSFLCAPSSPFKSEK